ncbi:SAP domain-containing ribonucleoprotein isoform 2 [Schistosoma japonicum]|uniref:DNA-binding SAP,domain-containing protein n=1 Tax=Schistosoma japonicum TaxID=6182 RepID=C1LGG2_SCHJA|nr:SAP domain-containing ribonucleoprotein isoform 2 [Schistosoma japonicum]TNN12267.1 SAP domain-containing ribonucleoprotein isoform 2 [Schistosoma japonicum]CAX73790.1 DNA-binding SAP,domain-containing protein [Schistosoma japonicum]
MSESLPTNIEDLHKLKLSDLKKICKENKLSSTGTKVELISRITEIHGNKFVLLQPGDEAELLGDDEDGDSNNVDISHTDTMDCNNNASLNSVNFPVVSPAKNLSRKRPASELTPEKDLMKDEKALKIAHTIEDSHVSNSKEEMTMLSDSEHLTCRIKRFTTDEEKSLARAKRFGLPINSHNINTATSKSDELEKLKRRAERFGQTTSKTLEMINDLERKAKRLEKFGTPVSSSGKIHLNDELAKSIRAQKFGLVLSSNDSLSDAEKLSRRQARFGLVDSKI